MKKVRIMLTLYKLIKYADKENEIKSAKSFCNKYMHAYRYTALELIKEDLNTMYANEIMYVMYLCIKKFMKYDISIWIRMFHRIFK